MTHVDLHPILIVESRVFISDNVNSQITERRDGTADESHCSCGQPVGWEELINAEDFASVYQNGTVMCEDLKEVGFAIGKLGHWTESQEDANFLSEVVLVHHQS